MNWFQNDARVRFCAGAVVTFFFSILWWGVLFYICPSHHAWRWAANHLTFGLWHTFIMPIAVGLVFGTLEFRTGVPKGFNWRRTSIVILGAAVALWPILSDANISKVEPYMLQDQRYLDMEEGLRRAHWGVPPVTEDQKSDLIDYDKAMDAWKNRQWSQLNWMSYLNLLVSWYFVSFLVLELYCIYVVLKDKPPSRNMDLTRLSFAWGLTCVWFPFRHYADWFSQYFLGLNTNYPMFFLFIASLIAWVALLIAAAWNDPQTTAPRTRSTTMLLIVVFVIVAVGSLTTRLLPSAIQNDFYHQLEQLLSNAPPAIPLITCVAIFVFVFSFFPGFFPNAEDIKSPKPSTIQETETPALPAKSSKHKIEDVKLWLLKLKSAEDFTSYEDLRKRRGCSKSTLWEAVQSTPELKEWATRSQGEPKAQSLNEVITDQTAQNREPDPLDAAAEHEFIGGADEKTKGWFLSLSGPDRLRVVENQNAYGPIVKWLNQAPHGTTEWFLRLSLDDQLVVAKDPDKHKLILGRKP